jgi:hypothetical protein
MQQGNRAFSFNSLFKIRHSSAAQPQILQRARDVEVHERQYALGETCLHLRVVRHGVQRHVANGMEEWNERIRLVRATQDRFARV